MKRFSRHRRRLNSVDSQSAYLLARGQLFQIGIIADAMHHVLLFVAVWTESQKRAQ